MERTHSSDGMLRMMRDGSATLRKPEKSSGIADFSGGTSKWKQHGQRPSSGSAVWQLRWTAYRAAIQLLQQCCLRCRNAQQRCCAQSAYECASHGRRAAQRHNLRFRSHFSYAFHRKLILSLPPAAFSQPLERVYLVAATRAAPALPHPRSRHCRARPSRQARCSPRRAPPRSSRSRSRSATRSLRSCCSVVCSSCSHE